MDCCEPWEEAVPHLEKMPQVTDGIPLTNRAVAIGHHRTVRADMFLIIDINVFQPFSAERKQSIQHLIFRPCSDILKDTVRHMNRYSTLIPFQQIIVFPGKNIRPLPENIYGFFVILCCHLRCGMYTEDSHLPSLFHKGNPQSIVIKSNINRCGRMWGHHISRPTSYISMLTLYFALPCWALHRNSRG